MVPACHKQENEKALYAINKRLFSSFPYVKAFENLVYVRLINYKPENEYAFMSTIKHRISIILKQKKALHAFLIHAVENFKLAT